MMTDQTPIAQYSERLLQVRRDFALYQDHVVVRARWLFKGEFQTKIPLAGLRDEPRLFPIRYRLHRRAMIALTITSLVTAILVLQQSPPKLTTLSTILAILAGIALLVSLATRKRVTFARFDAAPGNMPLDVAAAGPSSQQFEQFVRAVQRQIRRCGNG